MKSKFATYDLCAVLHDLNPLKGMRVANVYDINSKCYLIKLQRPNEKAFILFESGIRLHLTTYEWSKATIPSGFSMKFRKHINTKRLTAVSQVGVDRIVDLQFGDAERSCHVIVELYDRGNVILTDHEYMILNILRPRTDHDKDVRFSVRERYPFEQARQPGDFLPSPENTLLFLQNAQPGDLLRKALARHAPFGTLLLDHAFTKMGIPLGAQIGVHIAANEAGAELICRALEEAKRVSDDIVGAPHGGFIAYEEVARKPTSEKENEAEGAPEAELPPIQSFQEYYPYDFVQFRSEGKKKLHILEFETFSEAVDKYYSSIDAQKTEQRVVVTEKEADKKLQNIRKDHEKRIQALAEVKEIQEKQGEFVLYNKQLVDQGLLIVRTALANLKSLNKNLSANHRGPKQAPKTELGKWLESLANLPGGEQPAAKLITKLKLESNRFTMRLSNPYEESEPAVNVDLDLGLNADQNARRLFQEKRLAESKKEKTAAATKKALKSALKSAKQHATNKLNQAKARQTSMIKTRKLYWFEKFNWFISSDGFMVLAGRDAQQNELLVKRYMRPGDIYVHAEIQGASSVVIRNRSKSPLEEVPPPRTLNEAGAFAVCFSTAWEANVSITSWWVRHDQVSRTAPSGQFIVAGSFMIRGKRNFLSSCPLHLGFGLMFRLDDESVARHRQNKALELKEGKDVVAEPESETVAEDEEEAEIEEEEDEEEVEGEEAEEEEFPDVQVRLTGSLDSRRNTEEQTNANSVDGTEVGEAGESNTDQKQGDDPQQNEAEAEEEEEEGSGANEEEALIESITAQPLAEDQLLFAMPVCAPYTAMQKYKFKVKITPGTCKRGKAVKIALDLFNRTSDLSVMERTLLKSLVGDDRLMQQMPGKVRVYAPLTLQQKGKTKGKK